MLRLPEYPRQACGQDTDMRFRTDVITDRDMNRPPGHDMPAVPSTRIRPHNHGTPVIQALQSRTAGAGQNTSQDKPIFPPFRPGTPAGICTAGNTTGDAG